MGFTVSDETAVSAKEKKEKKVNYERLGGLTEQKGQTSMKNVSRLIQVNSVMTYWF